MCEMKALLVSNFHYRKGGGETYYFDLGDGLRLLGHEVVLFSMHSSKNGPCEQECCFARERHYDGGMTTKIDVSKEAR